MIFDDYDLDPLIARSDDDFTCPLPPLSQRLRALLAPRPTLKLLDLSRFQLGEVTDVQAIKDAGYVGVILQDDSAFSSLWPIFLYGGMVVITYHLFHAEQSGIDQAHKHMEIVYPLWQAQGARYPALDDIEVRDRIAIPVRQARAEDWRAEIAKETRAGTYCSPCLWEELMDNIPLGDQIGWDACWNSSDEPTLPVGWTREKTLFRQIGVSRKHSWVEIVPGMAGDVDCNVFYGNLTDLYNLGGVNPPPNGEPPMTAIDDLKAFRQNLSTSVLELDSIIAELEATPPPPVTPPPVTPPPSSDVTITISADPRANSRYYKQTNANGKPIMIIYPSDSAPVGERIQFAAGVKLKAKPAKVTADGGLGYWQLTEKVGRAGEVLFIREIDATKA